MFWAAMQIAMIKTNNPNGRVGRALAKKTLAEYQGEPTLIAQSFSLKIKLLRAHCPLADKRNYLVFLHFGLIIFISHLSCP
jgi:hypothetical protein